MSASTHAGGRGDLGGLLMRWASPAQTRWRATKSCYCSGRVQCFGNESLSKEWMRICSVVLQSSLFAPRRTPGR